VGEERAAAFAAFAELPEGDAGRPGGLFLGADSDKEHRTAVHRFFRAARALGGSFETETAEGPSGAPGVGIKVLHTGARGQKRARGGGGRGGAKAPGGGEKGTRYCHFTLHKVNVDTAHAVGGLARSTLTRRSEFGFAGTKDKRGVTLQRCSVNRVSAERLARTNGRVPGVRVGDFEYAREQLYLGDLQGNHFTVTLRDLRAPAGEAAVGAALEELRGTGFVNYFGLQRFGHADAPTHKVGVALLRGNWAEAVRLVMTSYAREGPAAEACARFLQDWNAGALLAALPLRMTAERAVAEGVKRSGKGKLVEALRAVPRNTRTMYLHSYQSLLWNEAASERVSQLCPTHAVEGDLVLCDGDGGGAAGGADAEPGADGDGSSAAAKANFQRRGLPEVRHVTREEAEAQAVPIDRVVLPLPGTKVTYPKNASAEAFRRIAKADGVDLEAPQHGERDFSLAGLPGAYRKLVHIPADLEWKFLRYEDDTADLIETDVELLEKAGQSPPGGSAPQPGGGGSEGTPAGKLALQFQVTLPPSCYATMLIREMLKTSTSAAFHKSLNGGGAAKAPGGITATTAAQFRADLEQLFQVSGASNVLVVFNAGPGDPSGSWCPDCRRALPVAERMAADMEAGPILRVDVGDRAAWKGPGNEAHPLRAAPDLQLSCVPTLRWASRGGFGAALGPELEGCADEAAVRGLLRPFLQARGGD
jgi:tRNA pseudouridine13 synthase